MSNLYDAVVASFYQLLVVFLFCLFFFGVRKLFFSRKSKISLIDFLGLKKPGEQFDKTFWLAFIASIFFAVLITLIQFKLSPTFRGFLLSETSPYGKILKDGFRVTVALSGFFYCFIQSGGAEELLFRGLIARRLFQRCGFKIGNVLQAAVFWLLHLFIFRWATGEWVSWIQFFAFVVSFGFGLVLGFLNARKGGRSIAPSWIIHSTTNFVTFLTLAALRG